MNINMETIIESINFTNNVKAKVEEHSFLLVQNEENKTLYKMYGEKYDENYNRYKFLICEANLAYINIFIDGINFSLNNYGRSAFC